MDESAPTTAKIAGSWLRTKSIIFDGGLFASIQGAVIYVCMDYLLRSFGQFGFVGLFLASFILIVPLAALGLIFLIYFAVCDARIGGGGTLGKRIFKLRVVNRRGQKISLLRSLVRSIVLIAPVLPLLPLLALHAGHRLGASPNLLAADIAIRASMYAAPAASFYLLLANNGTGQLLHDLVARTFVVPRDSVGLAVINRIAPIHFLAVGAILAIVTAWPRLLLVAQSVWPQLTP